MEKLRVETWISLLTLIVILGLGLFGLLGGFTTNHDQELVMTDVNHRFDTLHESMTDFNHKLDNYQNQVDQYQRSLATIQNSETDDSGRIDHNTDSITDMQNEVDILHSIVSNMLDDRARRSMEASLNVAHRNRSKPPQQGE